METQESSHLRFLGPGLRERIERSSRLVTGGRGSRRRVVCAPYRRDTALALGSSRFASPAAPPGCNETRTPRVRPLRSCSSRTANYPAHDLAVMLTTVRHETGAGCWCSFSGMPSHPSTVVRKMSRLSLAPAGCRGPSLAMHPPCGGEAFAGEEHGRFAARKRYRASFETLRVTFAAVRNRATNVPVLLPACRLRRE